MHPLVRISLVLGGVLGTIYIVRDYMRDQIRTKVQLLNEDLEEEASPDNEEVYFCRQGSPRDAVGDSGAESNFVEIRF